MRLSRASPYKLGLPPYIYHYLFLSFSFLHPLLFCWAHLFSTQPHLMSRFKQPPPHTSPPPSPLSPTSPPPLSTLTSHFVQALHDYIPTNLSAQDAANCLCFSRGNIIEVLGRDDSGWWDGSCNGNRGWFPSNYVGMIGEAVRTETYSDEEEDAVEENSSSSSNSDSLCSNEDVGGFFFHQ